MNGSMRQATRRTGCFSAESVRLLNSTRWSGANPSFPASVPNHLDVIRGAGVFLRAVAVDRRLVDRLLVADGVSRRLPAGRSRRAAQYRERAEGGLGAFAKSR